MPVEDYEQTVDTQHEHHDYEPQPRPEHHEMHAVREVEPVREAEPVPEPARPAGERRVVLQLTDGQTVELRRMWDADEAVEFAREAVRRIAAAEASGEWPDLDGRFLRPDTIFSVDIQVAD